MGRLLCMRSISTLVLLSVSVLTACGETITSGGIVVYKKWWTKTVDELRYQASIDLRCDLDSINFTLAAKQGKVPTKVYAEGCSSQALYIRRLRRHGVLGKRTDRNTVWERVAWNAETESD